MARMIPPRLAPETPDSERRVYERFEFALPSAWTVIHSQRFLLPQHRRTQEGELDFLVLNPSRGAIGLEVKGGWVQRTAAGWSSVDRHGRTHEIKDPGQQASSAIHAIAKYWEQAPGFGGRGFRCGYGWGVVLPDIECPGDLGPDFPRDVIVDRADLMNVENALDRVFRCLGNRRTSLSTAGVKALVATLRVRYPPASSLALQFKEDNEKLWQLTEEQTTVLDSLAAHNRAAIEGAAGTGKTVLAMEKARRLATTGQRVLLLCFNEPLARDLSQQADGFEVETFHGFGRRLARRAGLGRFEPRQPDVKNSRIAFYTEEAPMVLLEALERLPDERYDAIVVDEAQDFLPDWWPCLDSALRYGREGTLYAFYDPNQRIYGVALPKRSRSSNTNWSTTAATRGASPATRPAWSGPNRKSGPGRPKAGRSSKSPATATSRWFRRSWIGSNDCCSREASPPTQSPSCPPADSRIPPSLATTGPAASNS